METQLTAGFRFHPTLTPECSFHMPGRRQKGKGGRNTSVCGLCDKTENAFTGSLLKSGRRRSSYHFSLAAPVEMATKCQRHATCVSIQKVTASSRRPISIQRTFLPRVESQYNLCFLKSSQVDGGVRPFFGAGYVNVFIG